MKTAKELLHEIVAEVLPPPRSVITLTEMESETPNWKANVGSMPDERTTRFRKVVTTLAKTDPQIDWRGETMHSGSVRRTIHYREGGPNMPTCKKHMAGKRAKRSSSSG